MTIAASALHAEPTETEDQRLDSADEIDHQHLNYNPAKLRLRDPEEFDKLVACESARIQRLVERLLGWNEREDIAQEVFIRAWQSIHRFRGESDVSTWLYAIAINLCRNHRRRLKIWERFTATFSESKNNRDPANAVKRSEEIEHVFAGMNRLSHKDRETIVLCCLEDKTVEQVAEILNKNKNTIEVRLHRARTRLKQILETMDQ